MPQSPSADTVPRSDGRWLSLSDGRVDLVRGVVERGEEPVRLTTLELRLLCRLYDEVEQVVTRDTLLSEVWGMSPHSLSRAVDSTVRRLRVKIEPDPSDPVHLLKVHGEGYRLVPARPVEAPANTPSPGFFGREDALARLAGPLPPLLSIVGISGIGKSRLVEEAARPGWLLVRLAGARTASDLRTAVALAVDGRPRRDGLDAVVELLAGHPVVVFDEAETVLEPLREVVARLQALPGAPDIVLTSQHHLGLPGEVIWPLEPLHDRAACALFQHASGCPDDARLTHLVEQLDHHPLALELAAGWWQPLGWQQLSDTLERRMADLPHRFPGQQAHHRSLGASLQWALARLTEAERTALRRLATFQRDLDADLAARALDVEDLDALQVLARLGTLHLIRVVDGGWRVLASVRQALPATDAERRAHASTVLQRARQLAAAVDRDPAARRALRTWLPDGISAIDALLSDLDAPEDAADLLLALAPALLAHGPLDVVRDRIASNAFASLDPERLGALRRLGAEASLSEGDLVHSLQFLQLIVGQHPGPETALQQGLILQLVGARDPASAAYASACQGPAPVRLLATAGLAGLHTDRGHPDRALAALQPALVDARRAGLAFQEAVLLRQWGRALAARRELADARAALRQAVELLRAFGELRMLFLTVRSLMEVELCLGLSDDANVRLSELRALLARHPVGAWEALVDVLEGGALLCEGNDQEAASLFDRALSAWRRESLSEVSAITHAWCAVARHRMGQTAPAAAHLEAAGDTRCAELARAWTSDGAVRAGTEPHSLLLEHVLTVLAAS